MAGLEQGKLPIECNRGNARERVSSAMTSQWSGRAVLHVDMDAFFAAIEQRNNPELAGKPVVVGGRGDPTERGVVSTASYEAREFGIHSAMPLRTALKRCPEAIFLPVNLSAYEPVTREVRGILAEFSPAVGPMGLDEAFVELVGDPDPCRTAAALKRRIHDQTRLTCSVGVAPNKLLAKIASELDKPDGLAVLKSDDVPQILWPMSVRTLWGIGPKTERRLAALGISTVGELAGFAEDKLVEALGERWARHLRNSARGIDDSPVVTDWRRKSVGAERTFQRDLEDPVDMREALVEISRDVAARAKRGGHLGRTVTVKLRFKSFTTLTRSLTLAQPTNDLSEIGQAALACFDRIELRRPVRLLGVRLTNLS